MTFHYLSERSTSVRWCRAQGCVLVVEGDWRLLGAFTDGDLRRALQRRGPALLETAVSEVMTACPRTCASSIKAFEAMQVPDDLERGMRTTG